MRAPIGRLLLLLLAAGALGFTTLGCKDETGQASKQRVQSINARAETFARAQDLVPIPVNSNFPLREVLAEYTRRQDLRNHPWYTYLLSDTGTVTHYFVSTALPVNSCAFLSSTEDDRYNSYGRVVLTAPSLDGIYYGGAGAASACNGWIFIDAASGAMGLAFGTKILTFDAPLILETEPLLIRLSPTKQ